VIRSLSTAVTGLGSHQDKMDVVGNNIANVNTTGFKSDDARFQDLISQTIGGATAPLEDRGGVNPNQVGMGTRIAATMTDHTQGSIETTGRGNDLAIEGEGFFALHDGEEYYHTRDGSFDLDSNREMVNSDGLKVMGWMEEDVDTTEDLEPIRIPLGESMEARASQNMDFSGNLNADAEEVTDPVFSIDPDFDSEDDSRYAFEGDYYVYDSLGRRHDIAYGFYRDGEGEYGNVWNFDVVEVIYDEGGEEVEELEEISTGTLEFDSNGQLVLPEDVGEGDPDTETSIDPIELEVDDAEDLEVDLGFGDVTQLSEDSEVIVDDHDGFSAGELIDFDIEETGAIRGTYSNGMREVLGYAAMSYFPNAEGLSKEGGNLFAETANSGEARIGLPGEGGRGVIQDSSLEMSNADLADEFTELVTSSRGFQANTRVISSSDEILTEVINMQR